MSLTPHPPTAARRAPPSPSGRGFRRAYALRIANKSPRFQRPGLSRPDLVLTLPAALILYPPRRGERAHGQRPMRRRGAIERRALSAAGPACVRTSSNLMSLVPAGLGTRIQRGVRAGLATGPWKRGRSGDPDAAGPVRRGRSGQGVNSAPAPRLPDNDRAERLASSKRLVLHFLRTVSGAPRPFPSPQRVSA